MSRSKNRQMERMVTGRTDSQRPMVEIGVHRSHAAFYFIVTGESASKKLSFIQILLAEIKDGSTSNSSFHHSAAALPPWLASDLIHSLLDERPTPPTNVMP